MSHEIIEAANRYRKIVFYLKELSPNYPEIHFEKIDNTWYGTTMVEFTFMNTKYKRHCVDSYIGNSCISLMKRRMDEQAKLCKSRAVPYQLSNIVDVYGNKIKDELVTI